MKNSSVADFVAKSMDQIVKSASHRQLFNLEKLAEEKCKDCGKVKDDCKCEAEMNAADNVVIKEPLVVRPGEPAKSANPEMKADDDSAIDFEAFRDKGGDLESFIQTKAFRTQFPDAFHELMGHLNKDSVDEKFPSAAQVLDDEGVLETSAGFDVAIDSLLTASAALDDLGMEKTATLSLKLASLVVEAKKSEKDKSKEDKAKEKAKKAKEKEKADEQKAKDKAAKEKAKEKAAKEKEAAKQKADKEKAKKDEMAAKDKAFKDKQKEKEKLEKEKAAEKAKKEKQAKK